MTGYADLRTHPEALADGGWWAVAAEFDGPWHAWRFANVEHHAGEPARVEHTGAYAEPSKNTASPANAAPGKNAASGQDAPAEAAADDGARPGDGGGRSGVRGEEWDGPARGSWRSSMNQEQYVSAVSAVREYIRAGDVYQANICRVMSAPERVRPDAGALARLLGTGNPAPYAGFIDVPGNSGSSGGAAGAPWPAAWIVSASPELGTQVAAGRISSGPIKGTAATAEGLSEKDRAENLMITDLVRNDLHQVCLPGTVAVTDLLAVEHHPGLVHLVSRVRGQLRARDLNAGGGAGWAQVFAATHPPGSISGAPKTAALAIIDELEPADRGPYCGQIGWIDADAQRARLAVGIRTFWWTRGRLLFGTGAGITYDSDPQQEWAETELKAARLVGLASR